MELTDKSSYFVCNMFSEAFLEIYYIDNVFREHFKFVSDFEGKDKLTYKMFEVQRLKRYFTSCICK